MSAKAKLLFIIGIPLLLIWAWAYILMWFLWWSKNNADINWWLNNSVESSAISSWDSNNLSGDVNLFQNSWVELKNVKKINVYIPEIFYNKWFEQISKKILKEKKIYVKFNKIKDINSYSSDLSEWFSWWDIDVFMIPADWKDTFKTNSYKIQFPKDISSMFNYVFYDAIKENDYTYIPYAIDPYITLVSKDKVTEKDLDMDILKQFSLISSDWKKITKTLFWMSDLDATFAKLWKDIYSDYMLILYNLVYQSYLSQNQDLISEFIYNEDISLVPSDSKKIIKVQKVLEKKNPDCSIYKNVCMLANGYWDISFWFLSYLDVWNKYFSEWTRKSIDDFNVYNFINSSNVYLVRGWWFMVNKDSKDINSSLLFINEYLNQWSNGEISLWDNTISAFNNVYDMQKVEKKYEKIAKFDNKFQLLEWWDDMMDKFIRTTSILDVMKGDYSVGAFLDYLKWTF